MCFSHAALPGSSHACVIESPTKTTFAGCDSFARRMHSFSRAMAHSSVRGAGTSELGLRAPSWLAPAANAAPPTTRVQAAMRRTAIAEAEVMCARSPLDADPSSKPPAPGGRGRSGLTGRALGAAPLTGRRPSHRARRRGPWRRPCSIEYNRQL